MASAPNAKKIRLYLRAISHPHPKLDQSFEQGQGETLGLQLRGALFEDGADAARAALLAGAAADNPQRRRQQRLVQMVKLPVKAQPRRNSLIQINRRAQAGGLYLFCGLGSGCRRRRPFFCHVEIYFTDLKDG
jgi:hypothetical protein